jgi:hypothetical protein
MDAPVLRVSECVKDRASERLPNAEHAAFTGMHDGAKADDELLISPLLMWS